jgi:hexosaminidase
MNRPFLVPAPGKVTVKKGAFTFGFNDCLLFSSKEKQMLLPIAGRLQDILWDELNLVPAILVDNPSQYRPAVTFEKVRRITGEGYRLSVTGDGIRVAYNEPAGAFYAVSTLKQLIIQYGRILPALEIADAPDFPARGIMLDISRDKIPTMDTIYKLVDFMADFKMNQLQLYVQGFSFAFSSHAFTWQGGTPVTGEDILNLDAYCGARFIQLVPNQNSFGHMDAWLARKEFAHLAECPDGYEAAWAPGKVHQPETLDPSDPGSIELVASMADDLLPYFTSDIFNVGCDETFELGKGKSKALCEQKGTGQVYLDFLLKVYDVVKARGKRMMFWGDIIMQHPEFIAQLPKDIIALEWGYEANHPFEADGKKFAQAGIDYYVCPGTSTWNTLSGRTENMKGNILNAAVNGKANGSIGYLLTDWGDNGHWQYLPFSYPGFIYGAAVSWNVEANRDMDIARALDLFVFQDSNGKMGRLMLDLGNYYLKEPNRLHNNTMVVRTLYNGFEDDRDQEKLSEADCAAIKRYVDEVQGRLGEVRMGCADAALVEAEVINAARFIRHGCDLAVLKRMLERKAGKDAVLAQLTPMMDDIDLLLGQHDQLWLERNRSGGLRVSKKKLYALQEKYEELYKQYMGE